MDALRAQGQSVWLDYIRRSLLTSGKLAELIEKGGITGVTANPTIFEKAIVGSVDYDAAIQATVGRTPEIPDAALYESLAVDDVRRAADVLRPVFDRSGGADGFVSLEVSPLLADDTTGTVAEARRLWREVDRPNLLVKVPGTDAGIPAIEQLLSEGINVNVTLLFSRAQYEAVAQAFLKGAARAPTPERLASVASFFVSRVDTKVDAALDAVGSPEATALRGRIGIANCRLIYARYQELFHGAPFAALRARGVRPQRLLWASTSTKDPRFPDTLYVEELAGPETVNTVPPATLEAFRQHGTVRGPRIAEDRDRAAADLRALATLGVDLDAITGSLVREGVAAFAASFATLLAALASKRSRLYTPAPASALWQLGDATAAVEERLRGWQGADVPHRFWRKDPTFWPQSPASDVATRMGWLTLPEAMRLQLPELEAFVREVVAEGFRHVVVLGMGGSSLAPDVFARTFEPRAGYPELFVLDSTHPHAIRDLANRLDLAHTLFLVSSKSGTTVEPNSFYAYFRERVSRLVDDPGRRFVAITDPGTALEQRARAEGFRRVFSATPDVGGRYSALTVFGLVPAALLGVDLGQLLDRAHREAEASAFCVPAPENPAFRLGAALGELATRGRDKVTFLASPPFEAFPDWAEQLIAESTGKNGRGIVPVVGEPAADPAVYAPDRVFVSIEGTPPGAGTPARVAALAAAGHPVVRLALTEPLDLGAEFFRWEAAVAVAGPIVGIDPYDQPDVELAKQLAREAMATPAGPPPLPPDAVVRADDPAAVRAGLARWSDGLGPNDYLGIQAYLSPEVATSEAFARIRAVLLARFRRATTFGYGPRFLHSTGQLHKGGPPTGRFLQFVDDFTEDFGVPGADFTFGRLIRAQAYGDFQALRQRGRRILRVDLGPEVVPGLERFLEALHG